MTSFFGRMKCVVPGVLFLVLIAGSPSSAAVEMKAGVAKVVITTDKPLVMVNGRVSQGKLHDLHARALVLNDGSSRLVFVTYDLNCLDVATPILRKRVREELNIEPARLILLATHNHNAPIQINPDNFEYGRWLAQRLFDLIKEAIATERGPVRVQFGFGHGYFIMSSGSAPTDYEIQVMKVLHNGKPMALLFNHGTHPVQASFAKLDAGHPGYAMDEIEAAFPGVQAMYADACGGNQFPARRATLTQNLRELREKNPAAAEEFMQKAAREVGHQLAQSVLGILKGEMQDVTGRISSRMETLSLPLAPPISREEALELSKKYPPDVGFVAYPHPNRATNWVRMLLRHYEKGLPFPTRTTEMVCTDDTYLVHKTDTEFLEKYKYSLNPDFPCIYNQVIVSRIGPMPVVAMQGEVCAPIGARIKDAFRRDHPIMVFGYMGEHNLYIPTRELVRQKAYQGIVIQIQYASPVGWAPEVEDETVNNVIRMVKSAME